MRRKRKSGISPILTVLLTLIISIILLVVFLLASGLIFKFDVSTIIDQYTNVQKPIIISTVKKEPNNTVLVDNDGVWIDKPKTKSPDNWWEPDTPSENVIENPNDESNEESEDKPNEEDENSSDEDDKDEDDKESVSDDDENNKEDDEEDSSENAKKIVDAAKEVWDEWVTNKVYYSKREENFYNGTHKAHCAQYVWTVLNRAGLVKIDESRSQPDSFDQLVQSMLKTGNFEKIVDNVPGDDAVDKVQAGDVIIILYDNLSGHIEIATSSVTRLYQGYSVFMIYSWGGGDFGGTIDRLGRNTEFPEGTPPSHGWFESNWAVTILRPK